MRRPFSDEAIGATYRAFVNDLSARGGRELAGCSSDGSGGMYIVFADSLEAARDVVLADPLHVTGASTLTVWEWMAT